MTIASLGGPLGQFASRRDVGQRRQAVRRAATAVFDLGDHVRGSLLVAPDYQHVGHGCRRLVHASHAHAPHPIGRSSQKLRIR